VTNRYVLPQVIKPKVVDSIFLFFVLIPVPCLSALLICLNPIHLLIIITA